MRNDGVVLDAVSFGDIKLDGYFVSQYPAVFMNNSLKGDGIIMLQKLFIVGFPKGFECVSEHFKKDGFECFLFLIKSYDNHAFEQIIEYFRQ